MLLLHGANADPTLFPMPHEFRLNRPSRHLAFGGGMHYCLGAQVSRTVLRHAAAKLRRRRFIVSASTGLSEFGTGGWQSVHGMFS
jgi:cytochrome P450